ncbi:hypothetical protein [Stenomitos frigidus]|uniref:hypothetical protein n=1 Tax=Stenomitos frigidus TaxID=1886765 RepID=UPI001C62E90B|nr:hypothetical protein [Stenomitos frigidus]
MAIAGQWMAQCFNGSGFKLFSWTLLHVPSHRSLLRDVKAHITDIPNRDLRPTLL